MRCPKCGFDNNDSAKTCAKCGSFINPQDEEKKRNRKVVQLSSNQSADKTTPIDAKAVAGATQAGSDNAHAESKTPTPRRRSGSTGKIPALKHPTHEDGKIPVEQRRSANEAARARYQTGDPRSKQTIIDDAVLAAESATHAHGASNAQGVTPARTRDYSATRRNEVSRDSRPDKEKKGAKSFIIAVAVLIIICLIALGMFLVNTGSDDKTITFETNGGTLIGNQYVLPDNELSRPANPTRPGYTFDGWYLDASFSEKAEFPIMVTQDMTLYAKWKQDVVSTTQTVPSTTPSAPEQPQEDVASNNGGASGSANSSGTSGSSGSGGSNSGNSGATRPSTGGSSSGGGSSSEPVNSNPTSNGPVQITLVDSNGARLTGTVTLHDGYVIPDSSTKAYTIEELRALNLNAAELCIARNEIYARNGYKFLNSGLQSYFNARSWYHNTGWRGQFPTNSASYITAHNLLALAKENPETAKWTSLLHR